MVTPDIRPLNETLQKAAVEQLNEVPERIAADIEALRTWIKQQPHLKARSDDQFLVAFLRGCKYSLEKAKSKIDKFYTLRTKYPEYFCCYDADDKKVREILNLGALIYLPTPLHGNGPRIAIMRSGLYPADQIPIEDVVRVMNAMSEIVLLEDDYAVINGLVFLGDMEKATAAHLFQMTPSIMKKMSVYSEEALPLRPKQSHFIRTPTGFEPVFNAIKPMMSQKQQKRLYVHGDKLEKLFEHIPQKYLPKEYGGENGTVDEAIAYWGKKFDEYRDYFKEDQQYGTDEKLRPGKPIDFEGLFGLDGSFRKLTVD